MKKLLALVTALIVSCLPSWAALADSASKQLPLADVATLKAYALTQVNHVSGGVQASSISGNTWFSVPFNGDGTRNLPAALAAAVKKNSVTFTVDPTDRISSYAAWDIRLSDGSTWTAFWQQQDYSLIKNADGSYSLPPSATKLDSMEFGFVPFEIKGISGAAFHIKDEKGNTVDVYDFGLMGLVKNGYIVFRAEHAGQRGELHVQFIDGSKAIYTSTGIMKATTTATMSGFDTGAAGVRSLADNASEAVVKTTDDVLWAKYSVATILTVKFEGTPLPAKVSIYTETAFRTNPSAPATWTIDPAKTPTVSFSAAAGNTYVIVVSRNQMVTLPSTPGKG